VSLDHAYRTYLPLIEEELREALRSPHPVLAPFYGMMQYHLGWLDAGLQPAQAPSGKRVRPMLCLLACQAAGGDPQQALPAAASLELVHNFSLIHDDIEDNSATRRHRQTVWAIWGEPQAINAGDGMFALAYLTMGRLPCLGVTAERTMRALQALQETCLTLTEGQYLDMSFEEQFDLDQDDYLWMIRGKTATLLATCARVGGILAGADNGTVNALREYGDSLGMSFQIEDDVLGIWGDEAVTGKPTASDIRQRKKSLPLVHTVRLLREVRQQTALARLQAIYNGPAVTEDQIAEVLAILDTAGARAYCEGLAREYQAKALGHLDVAAQSPASDSAGIERLRELAHSLLGRAC
jgi:geranylgeranyl diphosphate synthase, type I